MLRQPDGWATAPGRDASEFEWLLFRQDGVLSRCQALAHLNRGVLRNRLSQGRWQRADRAVIVTHNGPLTDRQRLWVAVLGAGRAALCAGLTAASLDGLRGYESRQIHLLVPGARRLVTAPVILHRTTVLPAWHARYRATPPRTHIARSIVDAAAWAGTDTDARAIVATAFQQAKIKAQDLDQVLRQLPRIRRHALIAETARYAARGAHSVSEVEFLRLCRRYRLPLPDSQVLRRDRAGRVRYLDAYWPRYGLHVEIDGAWHLEVRAWWADMRRHNDLWTAGERVLRFPAWAVRHEPESVVAALRAALAAGGWRR